jgi:hypothetical protein
MVKLEVATAFEEVFALTSSNKESTLVTTMYHAITNVRNAIQEV